MVKIVVLDYGIGDFSQVQRALETTGAIVEVTSNFDIALNADGLFVLGDGSYRDCLGGIKNISGDQIIERRLSGGRAVLCVCVGMQLLFEGSAEFNSDETHEGLAQWPGFIEVLSEPVLPQISLNNLKTKNKSSMFSGISDEQFYFDNTHAVLSWRLTPNELMKAPVVTWANYFEEFVMAVENGPLWATQFHPEKSGPAGLKLLANWVSQI